MRMRTFMLLIMVFAMNILSAQERTITGIVVDGSMGDDPLPGATISVVRGPNKKVSHGTVTDYEGKFGPNQMPNNTILYGHNMLYKYKFSALNNYNNNIDFLRETPVVDFNTLYQDNKYKIFSVFITNTDEEHGDVFDYTKYVYFKNSDEFYEYIKEVMDRSKYNTGVDVEYGDELLTLSTCDGSTGFENMRLVIVARKVRENESPDVDTSKITRKDSIKYFKAYTDVYGDKWKGRTWDISLVKGMKEYLEDNGLMDDPSNY